MAIRKNIPCFQGIGDLWLLGVETPGVIPCYTRENQSRRNAVITSSPISVVYCCFFRYLLAHVLFVYFNISQEINHVFFLRRKSPRSG